MLPLRKGKTTSQEATRSKEKIPTTIPTQKIRTMMMSTRRRLTKT